MRRLVLLTTLFALGATAPAGAIVGGADATTGDWPWQVQVAPDGWLCGGTLVAPDRVVTAAHCTVGFNAGDITVYSGSTERGNGTATTVQAVAEHDLADVSDPDAPPRYDVAVLQLTAPVAAPAAPVGVIGTDAAGDALWDDASDEMWVTGWGLTSPGGSPSFTLREVQIPRVSDAACTSGSSVIRGWGSLFRSADMVCAGDPVAHKDSCNGDSGGPLVSRATGTTQSTPADWRLVGVVSWGSPYCGGIGDPGGAPYPAGVYARLGADSLNAFVQPGAPFTPKPRAIVPPLLGGTAAVGSALSCAPGTWEGATSVEREFWSLTSAGDPAPQLVGTGSQYTVQASDGDRYIACVELASNANGDAYSRSALSARVPATSTDPGEGSGTGTTTEIPPAVLPPPPPPSSTPVPGVDTTPPSAVYAGRACRSRRCKIAVVVDDDNVAPVLLRASLVRLVRKRCRRGGRLRTCTRRRKVAVTVTRVAGRRFEVATRRLARGRYQLRAWAVDAARNEQQKPLRVAFRSR